MIYMNLGISPIIYGHNQLLLTLPMTLKSTLLTVVGAAFLGVPAQAVLTITISPVIGDDFSYELDATGSGGLSVSTSNGGSIFVNGNPFNTGDDFVPFLAMSYGGESLDSAGPINANEMRFTVDGFLGPSSVYSFSGGPVTLTADNIYATSFTPGVYNITGGDLAFGNNPTGTVTINAASVIPEPSTYIALAGFAGLGLLVWRRRMQAKGDSAEA